LDVDLFRLLREEKPDIHEEGDLRRRRGCEEGLGGDVTKLAPAVLLS
jgi:hypothetical protein